MTTIQEEVVQSKNLLEVKATLDGLMKAAIAKVNAEKENELCKYLPGNDNGYMHHFTFKKKKNAEPQELAEALKKHILEVEKPKVLQPKQRAPRGSRKKREPVSFSPRDLEQIVEMAKQSGKMDLVARLSPRRSLPALKRELRRSISEERVCPELWHAYSEAIQILQSLDKQA